MSLKDIEIELSYNSRENSIVDQFYIPCLRNSIRYERAVGYFTSGILNTIANGLTEFLANNGTMKLICSPKLTEDDVEAIEKGYGNRDAIISGALLREIEDIPENIIDNSINFLSWLISANKLDIKIALPENISSQSYGIYHEKIGLFYDDMDNVIVFSGSNNETLNGVAYNYESFDVYKSWIDDNRCREKTLHFQSLWNNESAGIKTYDFPIAVKNKIIEKIKPQEHPEIPKFLGVRYGKKSASEFMERLWYFQKEAIASFKENEFNGILSMATGTGKTKTAVGCMVELKKSTLDLFCIISCPQNTIIRQWEKEIKELDIFKNLLIADGTNPAWPNKLADAIIDYNDGYINNYVVFTTYNTLSNDKFIKTISRLRDKASLIICDEVHWSGAETFRNGLLAGYKYRLGLSATPSRYMDEEGTDEVMNYFNKVVYEFSLERALKEINPVTGKTFLTPYRYYPKFVALDGHELEEYHELTDKIKRQAAKEKKLEKNSNYFSRLCEQRQLIIVNAQAKYQMMERVLESLEPIKYLLLYCSPQQIDEVQTILNTKNIINHRFTGSEGTSICDEYNGKSERDYILSKFESGDYKALVAMRCLDEGINILRAEYAILMASSGNPKEYIQRRGRLLRRHEEKKIVHIYDIIVMPSLDRDKARNADSDELKILKKEFKRYEEFARLSDNRLEAMNEIFKIKEMYRFY